ncbi:MAG: recO [Hydrocarboniphaga sp.]|uniref:DNA repair protein RecO n=1 Tax=Hydrocarboniphaga sp. TaxID=2033016 RepID=UPI0026392CF7|nr:DNA repair protein RecO [Hydrocarboniphaga sp.]MDB5967925.1 recO [Hydrocarboniphaga sp.]
MTRARIQLAPGHVLRTQPYRETSLLVEAWTYEYGRIGLVARGSRGAKSKTRALLQPFQPLLLSWNEQGDLGALTSVEADGFAATLSGEAIFSGWYLNELLLRLLQRHDPHPALYAEYVSALARLPSALEPALRIFEKHLLSELGYGLQLPDDIDAQAAYRYDVEHGPMPADADAGTFSGASLIALRDEAFDADDVSRRALNDARRLLRLNLKPLLGDHELQASRLLRALRARAK